MSSNRAPADAPNLDKREFCRACSRFATGVLVATVLDAAGKPHGMTVNSFTSVSLAPPLVLFCVAHTASILRYFRENRHFGINVLTETQRHLSEHFARKGVGRFEASEWYPGQTGVPLIPDVLATLECHRVRIETAGDHDILFGEVLHTRMYPGKPLIFFDSAYHKLER